MSNSLSVNCGNAVVLSDRENILEKYKDISFNCGNVYVADSVYAKLANMNASFNCGNTTIVKAPENPVKAQGLLTIDGDEYAGTFPVCDNALVTVEGMAKLGALEGMIATGGVYYPENSGSLPAGIFSSKKTAYPKDAVAVIGDAWLKPDGGGAWLPNTKYFISGTTYAIDAEYLDKLTAQGTSFHCGTLYLYASMQPELGKTLNSGGVTVIPDGYAVAKDGAPLMDLYATYGKKVYVLRDITVQPREVKHISRFESIIVRKTANLPMEHFDALEGVIKAEKISLFEGERMDVNGFQTLSHAMFKSANESGIRYAIKVNGFLLLEDDVTDEDVQAIASLTVNGAVSAPGVTKARLNQVAKKINGAMLPSLSELNKMLEEAPESLVQMLGGMAPAPLAKMLGIDKKDEGNSTSINSGNYVLI